MVILGVDAHKRSHTVVAVDELGRKLGERSITAISADHLALLEWAERFGPKRLWAVEDCRHLSRRPERDLLGAGETIVRVPPKLMAHTRDSARTFGKSDHIDALAVARALFASRTSQQPTSTGSTGRSGSCLPIARLWSRSGRALSTGCDGTSTRSIPHGSRRAD
jgi:transposase